MRKLNEFLDFSEKLYLNHYFGESLLVLHGISFGVKIGKQLKLKWGDFINEKGHVKDFITIDGRRIPLSAKCKHKTVVIYRLLQDKVKLNDFVYTTKKGVLLSTCNLSKNLKRLAQKIYNVEYDELTSSSLEKVWALSIIELNGYDKSIFIFLKDYMGKRTTNELIDFVGVKPKEKNLIRFDLIDEIY
jgi:hypothetical protein